MAIFIYDKEISTFTFPGGERHLTIGDYRANHYIDIIAFLYCADDIISLLLVIDALRVQNPDIKIKLILPYLPYARQDRVCNFGEALSIRVMANIINNLNVTDVELYDPHSDVSSALINNSQIISVADIIINNAPVYNTICDCGVIVCPDAGAEKKTIAIAKACSKKSVNAFSVDPPYVKIDIVYGRKIRDCETGQITSMTFEGDVKDRNLVIVDDICDGGQTFIELAKLLKERGALDLYLYVTHGIFSKGLETLKQYYSYIYCYHTFLPPDKIDHSFLTVLYGKSLIHPKKYDNIFT